MLGGEDVHLAWISTSPRKVRLFFCTANCGSRWFQGRTAEAKPWISDGCDEGTKVHTRMTQRIDAVLEENHRSASDSTAGGPGGQYAV